LCTLPQLPVEITEHIASLCSRDELISLHVANKDLSEKTLKTFTEVHFQTHSTLLCDRRSLKALDDIAKHPHFGKAVRQLIFCVNDLPEPEPPGETYQSPYGRSDLEAHVVAEKNHRMALQRQAEFEHAGGEVKSLATTFLRFKLASGIECVRIDNYNAELVVLQYPYYYNTLEREIGRHLITMSPRSEVHVEAVLEGLSLSQMPVCSFAIDTWGCESWLDFRCLGSDSIFTHLESLTGLKHLALSTGLFDALTADECQGLAVLFVGVASTLETLELRISDEGGIGQYFSPGVELVTGELLKQGFPCLKCVDLEGYMLQFDSVLSFLHRHKQLESFTIKGCHFTTAGTTPDSSDEPVSPEDTHPEDSSPHDNSLREIIYSRTGLEGKLVVADCIVRAWDPEGDYWW
jgi:hypothetical protein